MHAVLNSSKVICALNLTLKLGTASLPLLNKHKDEWTHHIGIFESIHRMINPNLKKVLASSRVSQKIKPQLVCI